MLPGLPLVIWWLHFLAKIVQPLGVTWRDKEGVFLEEQLVYGETREPPSVAKETL